MIENFSEKINAIINFKATHEYSHIFYNKDKKFPKSFPKCW